MAEAFRADDHRRTALRESIAEGVRAQRSGNLVAMKKAFDRVLPHARSLPTERRTMANGYAAYGAFRTKERDLAGALEAYRIAIALAPPSQARHRWIAEAQYLSAEQRRTQGDLDEAAYAKVLATAPHHRGAQAVLRAIEDKRTSQERKRRIALLGAALLLAFAAYLLLQPSRPPPRRLPLRPRLIA